MLKEETMFLDCDGTPILLGDIIRAPIVINKTLHGTWGDYRIKKAPGGYVLSYIRSEKGKIFPEGYTGGYMHDQLHDDDEVDIKTLIFTEKPVQARQWKLVEHAGVRLLDNP